MSETPILAFDGVTKTFGGLKAIDDLTVDISESLITGIIGPNGAGKTTLFNLVTGFLHPTAGTIRLHGESIDGKSPHEIANRGVGRSFQTPKLFDGMTVSENLAFAARNQPGESVSKIWNPLVDHQAVERQVSERVAETLAFLDLDHLAEEYARGLSGGQQKLLELGRVLMTDPDLLLLDEPIAGINPVLEKQLLEHVHELNDQGRSILLIEHDMEVVMEHCDRIVVMVEGRKLSEGPPEMIQNDERVIEAYLGGETV